MVSRTKIDNVLRPFSGQGNMVTWIKKVKLVANLARKWCATGVTSLGILPTNASRKKGWRRATFPVATPSIY